MKSKYQKELMLIWLISSILISVLGNSTPLISTSNCNLDYQLKSANSDSWSIRINTEARISECKVTCINNNIYALDLNDGNHNFKVFKYNQSGDEKWHYIYISNESMRIFSFLYVVDSECHLIILLNFFPGDKAIFLKLDEMGNQLILKDLKKEYGIEWVDDCIIDKSNSIILSNCSIYYNKPSSIVKLDINGTLQWNYVFNQIYRFGLNYDSGNNIYFFTYISSSIYFLNYFGKINSTGFLLWNSTFNGWIDLGFDSNENLYILTVIENNGYLLKYNSSGSLLKSGKIGDYQPIRTGWLYEDAIYIYSEWPFDYGMLSCFDLELNFKWNFTFSKYLSYWDAHEDILVNDTTGNLKAILHTNTGLIGVFEFATMGDDISFIEWGGGYLIDHSNLAIDSEDNVFFVCKYVRVNVWGERAYYAFLVKNPKDKDLVPFPPSAPSVYDYTLFTFLGLSILISLVLIIYTLKKGIDTNRTEY